jgi:hypothetical protein
MAVPVKLPTAILEFWKLTGGMFIGKASMPTAVAVDVFHAQVAETVELVLTICSATDMAVVTGGRCCEKPAGGV